VRRADRKQSDFRSELVAYLTESVEVSAVASVIDSAALVFDDKSAVTAVVITDHACAPMFCRGEGDPQITARVTFPPFEFEDSIEAKSLSELADAPWDNCYAV